MSDQEAPKVKTFGSRPLGSPPPPEDPKNTFGVRPLPKSVLRRAALGRGLDALIPAASSDESSDGQLCAPIGSIAPNPCKISWA